MAEEEHDYQKYLNQLQTVKKVGDVEILDSSDEFQMEKNETQYSQQHIYHSELDEFVIPPKEEDSVSIDTKNYESTQIVKPKIQPV
jgi:sorting nexin-7/30